MLVKSLIMLSSTAGCLLTGAGQAVVLEAPRGQPDRPFPEKRRQNDSGTIRAGHRREWKKPRRRHHGMECGKSEG